MLSRRNFLSKIGLLGLGVPFFNKWFAPPEATSAPNLDIAEQYHQESRHTLFNILLGSGSKEHTSPLFKKYIVAEKIKLPQDFKYRGISVEEAIIRRRSRRNFIQKPISLKELSCLLYYASGITQGKGSQGLRAAPSAGALYPIEIYPVIHLVEGIKPGIYHYSIEDHLLELLKQGDYRQKLSQHCLGQEFVGKSAVAFIMTAIFARTKSKYHHRAYRYALIEAGHIAENLYLSAISMGLGICAVGAFFDDPINQTLEIDGIKESAIYITVVGNQVISNRIYQDL
ncbi:MAG: SagB/ThcOx family dehydrogenase [bacterium]